MKLNGLAEVPDLDKIETHYLTIERCVVHTYPAKIAELIVDLGYIILTFLRLVICY